MYRPELLSFTSLILEMISEKKLLLVGSSGSSNSLLCRSHRAADLMSHSLIVPLLLLYTKRLHSAGWNSAAVMTSVSSSMFVGLMSTMSVQKGKEKYSQILNEKVKISHNFHNNCQPNSQEKIHFTNFNFSFYSKTFKKYFYCVDCLFAVWKNCENLILIPYAWNVSLFAHLKSVPKMSNFRSMREIIITTVAYTYYGQNITFITIFHALPWYSSKFCVLLINRNNWPSIRAIKSILTSISQYDELRSARSI